MKKFKYTICHPDNPEIEKPDALVSVEEALEMARNYPWMEELALLKRLSDEDSHYNPSLQFIDPDTEHELTITAMLERDKLEFSWWYNRPVIKKPFFGLGGEKTKMILDDHWQFNLDMTLDLLEAFLKGDYQEVRNRMLIDKKNSFYFLILSGLLI